MRNSMRWPLISLVGQAPVCQALEKFRGNLCHLDARERSFCTPRTNVYLPVKGHSSLISLSPQSPQFYVQLNRILHLHCWGALAISYSAYPAQSLRNVREHYTTDMMCSLYIAKNIFLLFCLRWKELVHYTEVHKYWSTFQLARDIEPLRDLSRNRNAAIL